MANRKIQKISVEYFNTMVGLKNKGLNPRQMDVKYVSVQDCEVVGERGARTMDSSTRKTTQMWS